MTVTHSPAWTEKSTPLRAWISVLPAGFCPINTTAGAVLGTSRSNRGLHV